MEKCKCTRKFWIKAIFTTTMKNTFDGTCFI